MKKALFIFAAILFGSIFNFGHAYTFLVRYNLMILLFFAFIGIRFDFGIFKKTHFKILAANILLPISLYFVLRNYSTSFAQIAFLLTIIPTAAATPVIAEMMHADIKLTTASLLLTTPVIALILPFLLPNLLKVGGDISTIDLILPIISVVFVPLFLSQLIQFFAPIVGTFLSRFSVVNFPLFLLNIVIGCGNASYFIQGNIDAVGQDLLPIIGLTAVLCVANFQIGKWLGRHENPLAFELALGRKNTMIGLWIALTYLSPIVALGPIFYIICHNVYNSWQMLSMRKAT
ncbi:MAG: hypothetical protein AAGJ18_18940 [Bacteroidota bacterium]